MWKMSPHMYNLCCFVVKLILSRFTHFCRKICFVAIYAPLCGEKFNQKLCLWRKKDKYHVCLILVREESVLSKFDYSKGTATPPPRPIPNQPFVNRIGLEMFSFRFKCLHIFLCIYSFHIHISSKFPPCIFCNI